MSQPVLKDEAPARRLLVPKAPILLMEGHKIFCLTLDGELREMSHDEAVLIIRQHMPIVCNGPQLAQYLKIERFHAYDVLELFAFVHPGKFCVPTARGVARSLNLLEPFSPEDMCLSLRDAIRHLLADLTSAGRAEKSDPAALAAMMGLSGSDTKKGWPFAPVILAALGKAENPPLRSEIKIALRLWERLPEWSVHAPAQPPGHLAPDEQEVAERLHQLLAQQKKEDRPAQKDYATALAKAFLPADEEGITHTVLAEAGTGTGKTLGYLAPATVFAEKNGGAVWISTFTRNLQRQVDQELTGFYDDAAVKSRRIVTRKGRENYLCLLNLEDATQSPYTMSNELSATALGLMIRWAAVTEDGDLAGKDFPGWLPGLMGKNRIGNYADKRGECIYAACPHFNKCFVEKSIRKAKRADVVIANHALVMHQTASSSPEDALPSHYIFDEGHHLFESADSAFSAELTGSAAADLRRWLLGAETTEGKETARKSRARGARRRLEDLIAEDDDAKKEIDTLLEAARCLPGPSWRQRLEDGATKGVTEAFLALCRQQVYARNKDSNDFYSLEADIQPAIPGLFEAAYALSLRLKDLQRPMQMLVKYLRQRLIDEAESLDTDSRERIRFAANSLEHRAKNIVGSWLDILGAVKDKKPDDCVDWLEVTRIEGRDFDTGFYRHYTDPARVFAEKLKQHASGVVVTSATLRDATDDDAEGWNSAKVRSGMQELSKNPHLFHAPSPFDYAAKTRILIVKDVNKNDAAETAAALRELFFAANGGALGLFTSVQRLKTVHGYLMPKLEQRGLPLYAQHIDPLDTGTLIDIFREEENACLLGTDAARDGIDVPGRSLHLVVYDRVPWPRPTILHKARREFFGKNYDDMLTRFKLKQAYGRLIRKDDDKGVFVMLDGALPSRLLTAFPDGVEVQRIGLKEAVEITKDFLKE